MNRFHLEYTCATIKNKGGTGLGRGAGPSEHLSTGALEPHGLWVDGESCDRGHLLFRALGNTSFLFVASAN